MQRKIVTILGITSALIAILLIAGRNTIAAPQTVGELPTQSIATPQIGEEATTQSIATPQTGEGAPTQTITLQEPELQNAALSARLDTEAGISAYFKTAGAITISRVRSAFRTIETETSDYLIGSVPVPDYGEAEDVKVYVHKNGWILAYYPAASPTARFIDAKAYHSAQNLNTSKLKSVLEIVAGAADQSFGNASYYDFRYPNATHMLLVGEINWDEDASYSIRMPSEYVYYERSVAGLGPDGRRQMAFDIDGVGTQMGWCSYCYTAISAAALPAGTERVTQTRGINTNASSVLVITYRVP